MPAVPFNPTQSVRFDVARGTVRSGASDDRLLLVPASAIVELARSVPAEAAEALGRALGASVGKRAASRIGDVAGSSLEDFVTQLAGEAALAGIGVLSAERWGHALVLVVEDSPLPGSLVAPFAGAALEAASGRKVWTTVLSSASSTSHDENMTRVLVSSESAVGKVREWIAAGVAWGDAITRLQGGGA